MVKNEALKLILDRNSKDKDTYLEIFAIDDKKNKNKVYSTFLNVNEVSLEKFQEESEIYNIGSYGVFINFNGLKKPKRIKDNVKKINFVFIDLDNADKIDLETVKVFLDTNNIKYSYIAQSGSGYHILIEVNLDKTQETLIKNFLLYLKNNICNKVDRATGDMTRLLRVPLSIHNKKDPFELKTLYVKKQNQESIKYNNVKIKELQEEENLIALSEEIDITITREDLFFNSILKSENEIKVIECLNNSQERNNIFIKNLAIFIKSNWKLKTNAEIFLHNFDKVRINHFNGWLDKAKKEKYNINYKELLKWSIKYRLDYFKTLLKKQLENAFLEKYSVFFVENEKADNKYLLYYKEKNYYVTGNLSNITKSIYYDCKENGFDFVQELSLYKLDEWQKLNYNKRLGVIYTTIQSKLESENRIKKIYDINYEPSNKKFFTLNNKVYFNIYRPTNLFLYYEKKDKYHFPNIKDLLMNLVGFDQKGFEYYNKWLGWIIKNPLDKISSAIIFQGEKGTGKGVFKSLVLDNIFGDNAIVLTQDNLESKFNHYLLGRQLAIGEEIINNENKRTVPNKVKSWIADPSITISRKHKNEIKGNNFINFQIHSNDENPIEIEEGDRRYTVFYSKVLKGSHKEASKFVKQLISNLDYELKEYISYLKSLKIEDWEIRQPYETDAKKQIQNLNKNTFSHFLDGLSEYNNIHDLIAKVLGDDKNLEIIEKDFIKYITPKSLYLIYKRWCLNNGFEYGIFQMPKFYRMCNLKSIISKVVRIKETTKKVYELRNIEIFIGDKK